MNLHRRLIATAGVVLAASAVSMPYPACAGSDWGGGSCGCYTCSDYPPPVEYPGPYVVPEYPYPVVPDSGEPEAANTYPAVLVTPAGM